MVVDQGPTSQRAPWAKQRILDTATELFYDEGIRSVGVDRLVSASRVTKATFYKHYRSKENLVLAYLAGRHERDSRRLEELLREGTGPAETIRALVDLIAATLQRPGFRGCLYLNAVAEYSTPDHPVRLLVSQHRDWYTGAIESLLAQLGHPYPGEGADDFLLARDGAMAGGYAGDPVAAAGALQRSAARLLAEAGA